MVWRNFVSICLFLMVVTAGPVSGQAYIHELQILEKTEISKLTDDQLIDAYLDVLVEMEATKTFHSTSGFTPKEYKSYKDLLKYRLLLNMEIHHRNLDLPQFND